MVRRIFAIVLIVVGLATAGAAVLSGTLWRPDDDVTLTLPSDPDVPLVLTAPGVLSAVDDNVRVRVVGAGADTPLVLAMGTDSDVRAWVGDTPHWEVTGLTDWQTLTVAESGEPTQEPSEESSEEPTSEGEGAEDEPAEADPATNPAGSDLWVEQVTGEGELGYEWTRVEGRWSMLVATDGTAPAPQVELTWTRNVATPFVVPGIIIGAVLALIGTVLLVMQLLADGERARFERRRAQTPAPAAVPAAGGAGDEQPPTRRQRRLAEESARRTRRGDKLADEAAQRPVPTAPQKGQTEVIAADDNLAQDAAAQSGSAATQEPAGDGAAQDPSETGSASELDAWVRSGAAIASPQPERPAVPADLEPEPETQHETDHQTGQLDDPGNAGEPEGGAEVVPPRRRSFFQRRREEAVPQVAADRTDATEVTEAVAPPEPVARHSVETGQGAVQESEAPPSAQSPQASGASWRQTWGLGQREAAATTPERHDREGER